jgi:hypothetical protein
MINILMSKLNILNSRRNFVHRNSATVLKPERVNQISYRGVANLMHLTLCTETRARYWPPLRRPPRS